ncbi:MAG: hypothetical protein ACOYN0_06460 [Phycisphaerales bacterium]
MRGSPTRRPFSALPDQWPNDPVNLLGLRALGALLSGSAAAADFAGGLLSGAANVGMDGAASDTFAKAVDGLEWPTRPLRLGVVNPGAWAEALHDAGDNSMVEWLEVPEDAAPSAQTGHAIDALMRVCDDERIELTTLMPHGHEAAWFDWGAERPLSYGAVFPLNLDCERLTCSLSGADQPEFVRALLDCAAWASRWPNRLRLKDRVGGRHPCVRPRTAAQSVRDWRPHAEPFAESAGKLMQHISVQSRTLRATPTMKAAARLVSAWLTTGGTLMTDQVRRAGIEACALIAGDETEVTLRLAAARLACYDDVGGLEALRRADRLLKRRESLPGADPYAFIRAEMTMADHAPLAVGRLAAGICMTAAAMSAERLKFMREDLAEDMQSSGLLVGREQDQRLLLEVLRTLEECRRDEPRKAAAVKNVAGAVSAA